MEKKSEEDIAYGKHSREERAVRRLMKHPYIISKFLIRCPKYLNGCSVFAVHLKIGDYLIFSELGQLGRRVLD